MYKLEPKSYFELLNHIVQKVNERLEKYLQDPSEENVHDVRISIRRLEASWRVLPKKNRQKPKIEKFVLAYKEFFKTNSRIRDFDIMIKKLTLDNANTIIELINKKKENRLAVAQKQAKQAYEMRFPRITEEEISSIKLEKRFNRIALKLIEKIQTLMSLALKSEKNISELHELRLNCKKLRYLLELTNSESSNFLKHLKQMQDSLGAIHDSDITIDFLKKLSPKYKPDNIIISEVKLRSLLFQEFVQEHNIFKVQ